MDREELIRQRTYSPIIEKIDRYIIELEKYQKIIQEEEAYEKKMEELQKQLRFAEQLGIITAIESWNYHEHIRRIQRRYEYWQRKERLDIVDDLENLRERDFRYALKEKNYIQMRRKQKNDKLEKQEDKERSR